MDTIEERIPNQTGETYLMPRKVWFCKIDCSAPKTRRAVEKWLDEYDKYHKPHKIIKIDKNWYEVYITNFGKVRVGDWLYYPQYRNGCGIGVDSWKEFPRQTLDVIDNSIKNRFYKNHIYEAAKRILERIKKDRKDEKESCKRHGIKADFS